MNPTPWTEEKTELLRQRWMEGISAPMIAEELGAEFTKNSVIGKAGRLKLPRHKYHDLRQTKLPPKPKRQPMTRIKATAKVELSPVRKEPPKDSARWIPYMDLNSETCRAILGYSAADGLALSCPNPKATTESYCHYHMGIYYNYNRSSR